MILSIILFSSTPLGKIFWKLLKKKILPVKVVHVYFIRETTLKPMEESLKLNCLLIKMIKLLINLGEYLTKDLGSFLCTVSTEMQLLIQWKVIAIDL